MSKMTERQKNVFIESGTPAYRIQIFSVNAERTFTHQGGNVGLLDAENCARFCLCEVATLNDALDLQTEMNLELLAFGMGETNIGTRCRCFFRRSCVFVF
jgi:hypothetical protein